MIMRVFVFATLLLSLVDPAVFAFQPDPPPANESPGYTHVLPLILSGANSWSGTWGDMGERSASHGGISDTWDESYNPSLAAAADGTAVIAWEDTSSFAPQIYVRRWNGSSWEEMGAGSASGGGISSKLGLAGDPSVAIAADGTPYIAFGLSEGDPTGNHYVVVMRWNGSAWEIVSDGADNFGLCDPRGWCGDPSLAIGADGAPIVAYNDSDDYVYAGVEMFVRRWNGTTWELLGDPIDMGSDITYYYNMGLVPSLAIAPDGTPVVAWTQEFSTQSDIYVRYWDGNTWEPYGESAGGGGISSDGKWSVTPSLAFTRDGAPVVAWASGNYDVHVRQWDGSSWQPLGPSSLSPEHSGYLYGPGGPSLAAAPDGSLLIAWADPIEDYYASRLYVLRWNGHEWVEVGVGSATGEGVSRESAMDTPSLAIASNGTPIVAWAAANEQIYVRRYSRLGK